MMSNCQIYLGDCLEVMKDIPDKSVDMILCDLPYGTTACKWDEVIPFEPLWEQYNRIIKDNGVVALFGSGTFTPKVMLSNIENYKYKWVWLKSNSTNFVHAKNRPMTKHEDILIFSQAPMGHKSLLGERRMQYNPQGLIPLNKIKKATKNQFGSIAGVRPSHKKETLREYTNYPSDVLTNFPEVCGTKKLCSSEKPIPLLEYLIRTYTNEGEKVLDNCMGSGSTGVACQNTNRNFIGIEIEEKYYNIARKRLGMNNEN